MMVSELKFVATEEKGEVSALLLCPDTASHLIVLAHGASTSMRHRTMESIAEALGRRNIASFRYNFPYSENGTARNSTATCVETVRNAVRAAAQAAPGLTLFAGGHSFGGRMTTTAQAEEALVGVAGLVLFSFPLHLAGRPDTKRADHLKHIHVPMLFLSGTRDELASTDLLVPTLRGLGGNVTLHQIETANHSYKVLKKARSSDEDVFDEMARVASDWAGGL